MWQKIILVWHSLFDLSWIKVYLLIPSDNTSAPWTTVTWSKAIPAKTLLKHRHKTQGLHWSGYTVSWTNAMTWHTLLALDRNPANQIFSLFFLHPCCQVLTLIFLLMTISVVCAIRDLRHLFVIPVHNKLILNTCTITGTIKVNIFEQTRVRPDK